MSILPALVSVKARVAAICRRFNRQFPPTTQFTHPALGECLILSPGAVATEGDPDDTWVPIANCLYSGKPASDSNQSGYTLLHLDEVLACLARDLGLKPPTDHPLSQPALRGYAPYYLGGSAPHQLRLGHLLVTYAGGVLAVTHKLLGPHTAELDGWQVHGVGWPQPMTIRRGTIPQGDPEYANNIIVIYPPASTLHQEPTP